MKQLLLWVAAAALLGCGSSVAFTRVGDALPPKPATCAFTILKAPPSDPFQELGTLTMQYPSQTAWIDKEEDFKQKIQPTVCHVGGDAVIAHTNDYGVYLKGTVLSLSAGKTPPPEKKAPAEASGAGGETDPTKLL